MKKGILFLIVFLNLGFAYLNAQIVIRETDVVERAIIKPKQFDSLSNITMQKHPIEYKKYIGHKLFFLPKSKNYKPQLYSGNNERFIDFLFTEDSIQIIKDGKIPFEQITLSKIYGDPKRLEGNLLAYYNEKKKNYENIDKAQTNIYMPHFFHEQTDHTDGTIYGKIGTIPDSVYGKYFTIIDIKGKERFGSKEYKKLEDIDLEDGEGWQGSLKIILRNESNQDTLYWIVDNWVVFNNPFFLVPYFVKQRDIYLNQNLVLKYSDITNKKLQNLRG